MFQPLPTHGAKTHQDRQGFSAISMAQEQEIVNKEWEEQCNATLLGMSSSADSLSLDGSEGATKWFLSPAAIEAINDMLRDVTEGDKRAKAKEPPYMLPSPVPTDYSRVSRLSARYACIANGTREISGVPSAMTLVPE